jgi:outer membrane protein OmpA-like peptidoglycan-associated protein
MEKLQSNRTILIVIGLVLMIGLLVPPSGYAQFKEGQKRAVADGEKLTVKGVILTRDGETFVLRDITRTDTVVALTEATKIRTERKGLFRGHKPFDVTVLQPGLIVQAKGKGDTQGRLVAADITFSEADLKAAITGYVQTAPVKKQLSETDKKLEDTSKEVVETNKRISSIDEYDVVKTVTVLFKVNSDQLGDEQKAQLDELASKAPGAKNYRVEVKGYTDPTGDFNKNLVLSQNRARSVVQYLAVKHNIPLRRIEAPMGYGETKPANESATAEARAKSRRVEVSVLVNKGLNK